MLRDGAKSPVTKFFLFGLMAMAVAGLVFMDVQGVFRGGVAPTDVAEIGDSKITIQDFNSVVRRSMQQQRMSEAEAYKLGVIDQLLNQEVQIRLLRREAIRQGLYVDDAAVARELDNVLGNISNSMEVNKEQALSMLLQNQQMSEAQLVGSMKTQLASGVLLDGVLAAPYAPQQLVSDFARFRYEKRDGRYAKITQKATGKPDAPDDETLKAYYETIAPQRFNIPEYRTLDVAILSPDSVKDMVELTDDDLRAEYENRMDEFKVPAQWSIAQTLVGDAADAQQIADMATKGGSLKKATEKVLDDSFAYIPPEIFTESYLPEELRETVIALDVNAVSKPIESPLGWHIIKLDKKIDAYDRSFDDVRDSLREELMADLAGDSLYDLTIQFDDMIAGGMSARDAAEELGVKIVSVGPVNLGGTKKDGKPVELKEEEFPALLHESFEISEGETTQLLQSGQSDYIAATVTTVEPASLKPFEEVRAEVEKAWMEREARILASKMAGKLIERIRAGESLDAVAKSAGLKVVTVKELGRNPAEESKHPDGLDVALFSIDEIGGVENLISGSNAVLVMLDNITQELPGDDDPELKALDQVAARLIKQDRMSLYRMALYSQFDVKTNEAAIEQMYGQDN